MNMTHLTVVPPINYASILLLLFFSVYLNRMNGKESNGKFQVHFEGKKEKKKTKISSEFELK